MIDARSALVTFGEAVLRLTPPSFQRLEQAHSLDMHVSGGELNVAVAAARLGLQTRWVSCLPQNPLGRIVAQRAHEQGVDISRIAWAPEGRVGICFAELGAAPRPTSLHYDRARSAMSLIQPNTIDWRKVFRGAKWFHTSGVTPALGAAAAAVTAEAIDAAKVAGLTVSYDLSYRPKLWSPEEARKVQVPLMEHVDILIGTDEDVRLIFGTKSGRGRGDTVSFSTAPYSDVARVLQDRFEFQAVALTIRENPKVWLNTWRAVVRAESETYEGPRYDVEVVDRLGAGDAFSGGFIFGALALDAWDAAVRYGTAMSALKHTTPGDFSMATREDVEQLLRGGSLRVVR